MAAGFSHLDERGAAAMVDVSDKPITRRRAVARANVVMAPATAAALGGDGPAGKGDVLAVARVAGIQAAKRTGELIPLCHPLGLDLVAVAFDLDEASSTLSITAEAVATGPTGVEMEALCAATVAALTVYDMCKAVDRAMTIANVRLLAKEGGRSGPWTHPDLADG